MSGIGASVNGSDADSRRVSDLVDSDDEDQGEVQQSRLGSEDEEGEDLLDNAAADYRPMPHLDRLEADGLDEDFQEDVTAAEAMAARLEAERELDRRDQREGRLTGRRRLPGALDEDMDEEDMRPSRRRRVEAAQGGEGGSEDDEDIHVALNLDEQRGPAREWVAQEPVQREIAKQFRNFLRNFRDPDTDDRTYQTRLRVMARANKQSLHVDYRHLSTMLPTISIYAADVPKQILEIMDKVAYECTLDIFPEYHEVATEVFVRIADLPIYDNIRDLRQYHLNSLVRVAGVVTRRTGVFPQLQMVKYDCLQCGYILGPFFQNTESEIRVGSCPACQAKGPFQVNTKETVYRNYQKLTLQESPGTVQAGRLPRHKEVVLLHDLIDCARPGEEVEVTGVYTHSYDATLNSRNGFPVFSTLIEANYISKKEDLFAAFKLTDDDKHEILKLGRDPRIGERICKSIAPSIYGHTNIKTGIALAMFGGQEKHPSGTHRLRGDINMLLLGDPGTAKSQFLKYVERAAQRAIYTTGKGASAVGLTAAVHKDPITREWTLEGGALVLADKGVCLIDEFDKMNDQDRVSIHEAMEQQSISISKAGIVTSLQARCSVIAAANPIGGRYDSSRTFAENVELSDPILSRFDILCVVKDTVDPVNDERLANFVVGSHMRSHPNKKDEPSSKPEEVDPDVIPQEMLRKYLTYAKQHTRPKMQGADYEKVAAVYAELRRESAISAGMPIAVRHLESMIRMSEAHARMHLRDYVNDDDIDTAIRVLLDSFVSTQKQSVQKAMRKKFRRFITYKTDFFELIMNALQGLVREQLRYEQVKGLDPATLGPELQIKIRALDDKVREFSITDLQPFFSSGVFLDSGFSVDRDRQLVCLPRL